MSKINRNHIIIDMSQSDIDYLKQKVDEGKKKNNGKVSIIGNITVSGLGDKDYYLRIEFMGNPDIMGIIEGSI